MMCVIIVIGYIITIPILKEQGYTTGELWLRSLDLITIAIPPALPAVLSSCIAFSLRSLAFKDIFSSKTYVACYTLRSFNGWIIA